MSPKGHTTRSGVSRPDGSIAPVSVIRDSRDAGASSNALAAAPRQLTIMADSRIAAETSFCHHLFIFY
jgi:hypothetical protein